MFCSCWLRTIKKNWIFWKFHKFDQTIGQIFNWFFSFFILMVSQNSLNLIKCYSFILGQVPCFVWIDTIWTNMRMYVPKKVIQLWVYRFGKGNRRRKFEIKIQQKRNQKRQRTKWKVMTWWQWVSIHPPSSILASFIQSIFFVSILLGKKI